MAVRARATGRGGVHHSLSSSCLALEIRLVGDAATRGRGTNWLYEPDGLGGLEVPTTGSRYVPRATPGRTEPVRYADLDLRRLNHSPHAMSHSMCSRTNGPFGRRSFPPIAEIGHLMSSCIHISLKSAPPGFRRNFR